MMVMVTSIKSCTNDIDSMNEFIGTYILMVDSISVLLCTIGLPLWKLQLTSTARQRNNVKWFECNELRVLTFYTGPNFCQTAMDFNVRNSLLFITFGNIAAS